MHKHLGGPIFQRIKTIYESKEFVDFPIIGLPYGSLGIEVIGELTDYERAVFSYKQEIYEMIKLTSLRLEMGTTENVKNALSKKLMIFLQKERLIEYYLVFLIFDRLDLWELERSAIGVDMGKYIILIKLPKPTVPKTETVNSFDELPEDLKKSLRSFVTPNIEDLPILFSKD